MIKALAVTASAILTAPSAASAAPAEQALPQAPSAEQPQSPSAFVPSAAISGSARSGARAESHDSEIVVTATRRDVRLQKLPEAVTAISAKRLDNLDAQSFQDYFRTVPGLMFNSLGPGLNRFDFTIRGVSNFSQLIPTENATVGQYLDDIPVTAVGQQVDPRLVDIERIEILRGPQGTYFGEDALSGTIRIITRKPNLDAYSALAESRLSWTQGGAMNKQVSAVVNAPIVADTLAFRANGFFAKDSGFIDGVKGGCQLTGCTVDSVTQRNLNPGRDYGLRGLLLWRPNDRLSFLAEAMHGRSRARNSAIYEPRVGDLQIIAEDTNATSGPGGQQGGGLGGPGGTQGGGLGGPDGSGGTQGGGLGPTLPSSDVANLQVTDIYSLYGLTGRLGISGAELVSTSSFGRRNVVTRDPTVDDDAVRMKVQDFAQELRLQSTAPQGNGWDYTVGLYFQQHHKNSSQSADGLNGLISDHSTDKAIFGDLGRKVGPISMRLGIRQQLIDMHRSFRPPSAKDATRSSNRNSATTGRFTLSYDITSSAMVYASVSRGFRRGGINPPFTGVPSTYKPDRTNDFEVGWKLSGTHGLFLNGDLFTILWNDMQLAELASSATGQQQFYANKGRARVDGVELEGGATLLEGVYTRFSLAYLDPRLTRDQPGSVCQRGCPGRKGDQIPYVSRATASISFDYERHLGTGPWESFANLSEQFASRRTTDFSPTAPNGSANPVFRRIPVSWLTNVQFGLASPHWRISLFVENLLDRRNVYSIAPAFGMGGGNGDQYLVDRPRTIGVWLRHAF